MFACLLLAAGVVGCNEEQVGEQPGQKATLSLSISFAASRATNATTDEQKISHVDVFIFNGETQTLANYKRFPKDSLTAAEGKLVGTISTTNGMKKIAVGVNLPTTFPSVTSVSTLKQTWNATIDTLTATKGFVMFSSELVTDTLKTDVVNKVTIAVDRAVAKVAAFDLRAEKQNHTDGTFEPATFAIRNTNKGFYPLQLTVGEEVRDHNWDSCNPATEFSHGTDYEDVNTDASAAPAAWKARYTTENTSELPTQGNSTYAVIRLQFKPFLYNAAGERTATQATGDFWLVKTEDGKCYYFATQADAVAFTGTPNTGTKYEGGLCYYSAYLDASGGYNTLRNKLYQLNITNIVPPGRPSPEPGDPDTPLGQSVDLEFEIVLKDWTIVVDEYELSE